MAFSRTTTSSGRAVGALAVGLLVFACGLAGWSRTGQAADPMTPLERLIAKDEIREKISEYGFLVDGDGAVDRDFEAFANEILAPVTLINGKKLTREALVAQSKTQDFNPAFDKRHLLINTTFDELTPTVAKTRTSALYVRIAKPEPGCKKTTQYSCGGQLAYASTWVYHDVWQKTVDGWHKVEATEKH